MKRSTFTPKPCKECGSIWHTAGYHNPRKAMRKEAAKTKQRRKATEAEWFEANPPDENGHWYCYIPKHPLCPKILTIEMIVLEHDLSKARHKGLQFVISNIHPACTWDNEAKGSLSAEEYMNKVV